MSPKVFIPIFFIFLSCTTKTASDFVPIPIMAEVIADMELAQAMYKFQPIDQRADIEFMFEEIYRKHQITKESFNESLKFYSSSPKDMDEIYNEAIEILTHKQAKSIGK